MKTYIRICILLCAILVNTSSFAQGFKVLGNVLDAQDGKCLNNVSITLVSKDSSVVAHVMTDDKGRFCFDNLRTNDYSIRFSVLGYFDTTFSILGLSDNYECKNVYMTSKLYQLNEITVSAQATRLGVDRITFFPSQEIRKVSQDALDVIRLLNMPDLKFDIVNHSFSSLKNGVIQIRIDGVISTQKDLIAIQPQDIARVEYVNNPNIIYGDGITAVILIKTRRTFIGIQSGARISQALTTLLGDGYVYLNLHKPNKRIAFKISENYNYANGIFDEIIKDFHYPDNILHLEGHGANWRERQFSPSGQLDYTRYFEDESFLNISLRHTFVSDNPTDMVSTAFTNTEPFFTEHTRKKDNIHSTSIDIYYSRIFKNTNQLDANITGTYIGTDFSQAYSKEYVHANYDDYEYTYFANGRHGSIIGELKYNMPIFSKYQLTFGTHNCYSLTRNKYLVESNTTPSHMDVFSTYNYIEFSGSIAKLKYSIGGGFSYNDRKNDSQRNSYVFFRPKLSLQMSLSEICSIQYLLSIVPNEPALSLLSNIEQPMSEYEVKVGNPTLKPYQAYSNRFTLSLMKKNTYIALTNYMQYNASSIYNSINYNNPSRKFVYSNSNQGHFLHWQTQLYASQKLFKEKLSLSTFGLMNHYVNHAEDYKNHYTAFLCGGSISFDEQRWGVSANYLSPVRFLFNEIKTTQSANIQLSAYYRTNHLQMSLSVNNPFRANAYTQKEEMNSKLIQSVYTHYAKYNNNFMNITLSYIFNRGKNKTYRQILQNADNDSGVMK